MPKRKPNKQYSGEFKQMVVETMRNQRLGYNETERQFDIPHKRAASWERIYLEEGPEGLYVERRGHANSISGVIKGRKPNFDKKVEEDLISENQRLRAEIDYLKKLNALVLEEERLSKRRR